MKTRKTLLYILTLLPLLGICMLFWLTRQFANPTIEEILFCLTTSISGTDFNTIFKFIITVIVPAIIYTFIYFLIFKYLKDEKKQKIYRILLLICNFSDFVCNKVDWNTEETPQCAIKNTNLT